MNWQQFLEKSFPARPDQKVVVKRFSYEDAEYNLIPVFGIEFDGDNVIITMEDE